MLGLFIALVLTAGVFWYIGYKYGSKEVASVKAEIVKLEQEILHTGVLVKAESLFERLKAIF